jgi:hypothetical protein
MASTECSSAPDTRHRAGFVSLPLFIMTKRRKDALLKQLARLSDADFGYDFADSDFIVEARAGNLWVIENYHTFCWADEDHTSRNTHLECEVFDDNDGYPVLLAGGMGLGYIGVEMPLADKWMLVHQKVLDKMAAYSKHDWGR